MDLLGFDVGFSEKKRSSGIAKLTSNQLVVGRATATWETRGPLVRNPRLYDVAAIDAPLVPEDFDDARDCEKLFIGGVFQRRCKPGLSHVQGTGRKLREAGTSRLRNCGLTYQVAIYRWHSHASGAA